MLRFLFRPALGLAALLAACGTEPPAPVVTTIAITPAAPSLEIGASLTLAARVLDQNGGQMTGQPVAWSSADPQVAAVSPAGGVLLGIGAGTTTVTATSAGRTGAATVVVTPLPVATLSVANVPPRLGIGQSAALQARAADRNGQTLTGRAVAWSSANTAIAMVTTDGVVTGVAPGTATITATSEGISGTASILVVGLDATPQIAAIGPGALVPYETATITGTSFLPVPSQNLVTIGGLAAPVLSATSTQLTVSVPCLPSGPAPVRVTVLGVAGPSVAHPVATPQRSIAVGQSLVLTTAAQAGCNELVTPGAGAARYLVVAYSGATAANTTVDFLLDGNPAATARLVAPARRLDERTSLGGASRTEATHDAAHFAHLERERALYATMRPLMRTRAPALRAAQRAAQGAPLPAVGDMRSIFFTFSKGCSDTSSVIRARAIRVGARAIVWEDSANAVQSSAEPVLAGFYDRLGRIFDQDQYESVRDNFGDPLRRDAETDADGRVHMVFTQRLNSSGAAAYVTSCDQWARSATTAGSNFGEFFYGTVPSTAALGLGSSASPDGWFNFMARTVVHEVKHIASSAARIANGAASFEQSWLEEGTARHAEEVWVRQYLHKVPWRGNTGFGTAATNGIYCDFHPESAACNALDPLRRPGYGMRRHFDEIRSKLLAPWDWSPYGDGAGQTGSVFYQTTWSLVRYAIDRYGAGDAAVLRALHESRQTGVTNLAAVAGVSMDQLVGAWGLALYADDYPGLSAPSPDLQFPTWNLRSIYAGLNADPAWSGRWSTAFPIQPTPLGFGSFSTTLAGLRGGAHAYYELSGAAPERQLLALRSTAGGAPSPLLRIAIARLQ